MRAIFENKSVRLHLVVPPVSGNEREQSWAASTEMTMQTLAKNTGEENGTEKHDMMLTMTSEDLGNFLVKVGASCVRCLLGSLEHGLTLNPNPNPHPDSHPDPDLDPDPYPNPPTLGVSWALP